MVTFYEADGTLDQQRRHERRRLRRLPVAGGRHAHRARLWRDARAAGAAHLPAPRLRRHDGSLLDRRLRYGRRSDRTPGLRLAPDFGPLSARTSRPTSGRTGRHRPHLYANVHCSSSTDNSTALEVGGGLVGDAERHRSRCGASSTTPPTSPTTTSRSSAATSV